MNKHGLFWLSAALLLSFTATAFAAHPLITDDAGTQGAGRYQVELNLEYSHNDDLGIEENGTEVATSISYGLTDRVDIVVGLPWQKIKVTEAGQTSVSESGIADIPLDVKWRFYENNGLNFAFKAGLTAPTGNETKGLGTGNVTYSAFLIATKEILPFLWHLNLGYLRNENKHDELADLWHVSLATEWALTEALRVVANIGQEKNPDPSADKNGAFILGGVVYSLNDNLDIDFGVKGGLNDAEPDYALLTGIAFRF